jgi:hypothetical protein
VYAPTAGAIPLAEIASGANSKSEHGGDDQASHGSPALRHVRGGSYPVRLPAGIFWSGLSLKPDRFVGACIFNESSVAKMPQFLTVSERWKIDERVGKVGFEVSASRGEAYGPQTVARNIRSLSLLKNPSDPRILN